MTETYKVLDGSVICTLYNRLGTVDKLVNIMDMAHDCKELQHSCNIVRNVQYSSKQTKCKS